MKSLIKKMYTILTYHCPFIIKIIEYIYYYLNNLIADNGKYIQDINDGEKLLKKYTENDKYYYVLIDKGIGDTVIVASYAYYLKKKYNKDIAFIVLPSHLDVVKQFDYIKKIITCPKIDFDKMIMYVSSSDEYETNTYKYAFFNMKISKNGVRNWSSTNWDKKIILSDRYKKFVFNIPIDTKRYLIKTNNNIENKEIIKKYSINKKSIVIVPYAYTVVNLKTEFWEELVNILIKKGYTVYTNIGNPKKEEAINNTISLNISLDELIKISKNIKYFISLRCGLCEFLALNSPNMIVINDNSKNYDRWDDVNNFSTKNSIRNVYINKDNYKKIIEKIIKIIEGEK